MNIMNTLNLTEIEKLLFPGGKYKLPSYKDLMSFGKEYHMQFGHKHAMYTLPTIELIEFLNDRIGDKFAIEIGSGVGIIGKELAIKCTDNFCQEFPDVREFFKNIRQPTINYGEHVMMKNAEKAAIELQPDIILGSWITHKFTHNAKGGSVYGVNEEVLLDNCQEYIMLGNESVHKDKPILKHKPQIIKDCPGYVSRSSSPENNALYIWKGRENG